MTGLPVKTVLFESLFPVLYIFHIYYSFQVNREKRTNKQYLNKPNVIFKIRFSFHQNITLKTIYKTNYNLPILTTP